MSGNSFGIGSTNICFLYLTCTSKGNFGTFGRRTIQVRPEDLLLRDNKDDRNRLYSVGTHRRTMLMKKS